MPLWLCEKDATTRSHGVVNLGEESRGIVNFMNHGEQQGEVNPLMEVRYAERVRLAQSRLDPIENPFTARPSHQRLQHPRLKVHAEHAAFWTDETRQGETEEPHGGADIEGTHLGRHVRGKNLPRVLNQRPERIGQQIPNPNRTHVMIAHVYLYQW
jgi:hypothetical protein